MGFPLTLKTYNIHDQLIEIFEPDKNAVMDSYHNGHIVFPYWSQVWPAAIALAHFIINHPDYTKGKNVLELAAGLGLPSVVAARNATSVITSDNAEEAVTAIRQTVEYNCLQNMQIQLLDWYTLPYNLSADVLLLSDVSYDTLLFPTQETIINKFLAQGTIVIISTPQRLIAKQAITPLLSFCRHQEELTVMHNGAVVMVSIIVLQSSEISIE